ncbi:MAG: phosphatidate cytidylyltransferase [Alphaproteobacteria bacterium]|nr:phosphatidate cytidylyltransferase [Alphaproteobacteria bacterium]
MVKSKKNETKKMSSLQKRILTTLVMLPIVIGALWSGYPYVDVLTLTVGVLLAFEWATMVPSSKPMVYFGAYVLSLATSVFLYESQAIVLTIVFSTLFVYLKARKEKHMFLLTLGVPYISVGIASMMWLYHDITPYAPYNFYLTLWFLLSVWSMDVGAYIVGTNLKGPKLAPSISPNKTWSGLIGGIVLAVAVSEFYFYVLRSSTGMVLNARAEITYAIFAGLIAAVSQIGDLIESSIKRHLNLKDSSNLIPGHGGVFDRIDGLIFAAPFVYFLFAYIF